MSAAATIPHSRGLGSSAAAVVGGLAAVNGLVTQAGWKPMTEAELIQRASEFEGHPDNAPRPYSAAEWCRGRRPGDRAALLRGPVQVHPDIHLFPAIPEHGR